MSHAVRVREEEVRVHAEEVRVRAEEVRMCISGLQKEVAFT